MLYGFDLGREFWVAVGLVIVSVGLMAYGTAHKYEAAPKVQEVFTADVIGYVSGISGKGAPDPKFKIRRTDESQLALSARGNIESHYRGRVLVEQRVGASTGLHHYYIIKKLN